MELRASSNQGDQGRLAGRRPCKGNRRVSRFIDGTVNAKALGQGQSWESEDSAPLITWLTEEQRG